jgi:hypothetical protein
MMKNRIDLNQKKALLGIILKMGEKQEIMKKIHRGLMIILFQIMEWTKMFFKLNNILSNKKQNSSIN